jgi:hypothetical protein
VSLSYALMRFDSTIDPLPNVPALTNPCSSPGPQGGGGPPVLRSQVHPFLFQPPGNTGLAMSRSEREGRDSRVPFVAGRGPTGVPLPPPADTAGQTRHIFHPFPEPHPIHSETFFWAAGHKKTDCLQRTLCGHKKTDRSHELNNV